MKKSFLMLLFAAVAINVMAVEYTAKAVITLQALSGYNCEMTLRQSNEYAALDGAEMNMDGRFVALYAINGTTPLQTAKSQDLEGVKVGLKTDASTVYTITVSKVEGSETLYIWDADSVSYALTEGASYTFTAAANATDEARFVIKKAPMAVTPSICFSYNRLEIKGHAGETLKVEKDGVAVVPEAPLATDNETFDLSAYTGRLIVTLNGEEYHIDANL